MIQPKATVNKTHAGQIAPRPDEMWLNTDKASHILKLPSWRQEIRSVLKEIED